LTLEKLAKKDFNFYVPRFEVEIEGKILDANISKEIIDLTVHEKLDQGASFELTLHDEFDMKTQTFKWIDDSRFYVGNKITVKIGYGSTLNTMIKGIITGLEPNFFASETPTLKVSGHDLMYCYMKTPKPEETFDEKTYSDIVRSIAQEAGLDCVVDETGKCEKFIRKDNGITYYQFLSDLKNKVGFNFDIKGRTIYFIRPVKNEKILTLELGKDIISFSPSMNTSGLLAHVKVRGHNPQDPNASFIGEAEADSELMGLLNKMCSKALPNKVITNSVVDSKEQADKVAKAEMIKASETFITGNVRCVGLPQIRPGVCIGLDKMGKRFNGKYCVTATTHTINDSGYTTEISVKSSIKKAMI
jgi:phage protein D